MLSARCSLGVGLFLWRRSVCRDIPFSRGELGTEDTRVAPASSAAVSRHSLQQAELLVLLAAAVTLAKLIALLGTPGCLGSGGCRCAVVCPLLAVLSLSVAFNEGCFIILWVT